jgi:hypothetical protein
MTHDNTQAIAYTLRAGLYASRRSHPASNAQDNLTGRTHYVDPGTLRFHKSRILSARPIMSGAFFLIIESCALDFDNTRRGVRAVLFDLMGDTVYRPSLEHCRRTRDQASRDFEKWLGHFDPIAHYRAAMLERAERLFREGIALRTAAANLEPQKVAA